MLVLVGTVLIGFSRLNPPLQVKRIVQVTQAGTVFRDQLATDGPRLYFRQGVENKGTLQQMPIEGVSNAWGMQSATGSIARLLSLEEPVALKWTAKE